MSKKTEPVSLRRQLFQWLLTPLLPLLLVGVATAFYMAYHFVNLAYDRSLFRATLALADQISVVGGQVMVDLPQVAFEMLEYDKDDWIYYKVTGPHGEFVTGYQDFPAPPIKAPVAGQHYYYNTRFDGKDISVAAFYLSLAGTSANGLALVQVGETTAKRERMAGEIIFGMVLPQLLMVLLAAYMVWLGVRRGLLPLERLRREIASRSHRDLSPLSAADAPTEVVPILEAMNDLMSRLDQTMIQQHRFVADASHQLRTPLAGLKTQAEIALREQDPAQIRHALEKIQASSSRLAHLVSQLLSLARIEPDANTPLQVAPLDLAVLAREVSSEWVPAALAKHIDLGFESQGGEYVVMGDATLLRELLANLIDNAIRYTQPSGTVTISMCHKPDATELCVEDNGPGIPEDKRERVFERFYRVLGTGEDGCGLGLAIVKEVALRHEASVSLESGHGGKGTRICVTFRTPAAAADYFLQ